VASRRKTTSPRRLAADPANVDGPDDPGVGTRVDSRPDDGDVSGSSGTARLPVSGVI
jgi:hypothetical protein